MNDSLLFLSVVFIVVLVLIAATGCTSHQPAAPRLIHTEHVIARPRNPAFGIDITGIRPGPHYTVIEFYDFLIHPRSNNYQVVETDDFLTWEDSSQKVAERVGMRGWEVKVKSRREPVKGYGIDWRWR